METAIQVVWWVGLIGALVPTLVILKEVALVVRALRGIHALAQITARAARGVAANLAVGGKLAEASAAAFALRDAAHALAQATAAVDRELGELTPDTPPRGG